MRNQREDPRYNRLKAAIEAKGYRVEDIPYELSKMHKLMKESHKKESVVKF